MRIVAILLVLAILSLTGIGCSTPPVHQNQIDCNVAGYTFTLGDSLTKVQGEWPDLTETPSTPLFLDSVSYYSQTYEEHMFGFTFYAGILYESDFTIPQREVLGSSIEVDGKVIPYDTSFNKNMEVTTENYIVITRPNDFEGIKSISVTVKYVDSDLYLRGAK